MSGLAGGSPNLRLVDQGLPAGELEPVDVVVEHAPPPGDDPEYDDSGAILKIEHGDGSVTLSLDGRPLVDAPDRPGQGGWFENLAEKIEPSTLQGIAEDLLVRIKDDEDSRKEWIEEVATGLKIMGLSVEMQQTTGAGTDSAPVEGMSRIRHPLLQEAVLRFQANARAELLPTDGPIKIRNDDNKDSAQKDDLADALEKDANHYLTSTATEYYPDTDRMLLKLGFAGSSFKKVYYCPIRNRPVSETVMADDLIVHADATDLANARRITHRTTMRPSTVKRMQILGVYRDIDLSDPLPRTLDSVQREERAQAGVSDGPSKPEDRDREIYECCCELNVPGYEHKYKGKSSGLEVPYVVTIDVTSREILSLVRNYDEDTKELPIQRQKYVHYLFIPGFKFYGIGLLHILGNTTQAVTAAWREMLDAGMFSNFPGFLVAKSGARQDTNIFRVPPGGAAQIDTGGVNIKDAVMNLPYQPPSAALMQLVDNIVETGQRVGGTAELQVGEGRADMPVGTTLALIEQATKLMNSVHKRLHAAQAEEFRLLMQCFREHPESFWQQNRRPAYKWDEETFLRALQNVNFTPQADPNTASHGQRILKVMALKQIQSENAAMYDPLAVDTAALKVIGWNNPEEFFVPKSAQGQPTPEMLAEKQKIDNDTTKAQATQLTAQSRAKEVDAKIQSGAFAPKHEGLGAAQQGDSPADLLKAQASMVDAQTRRQSAALKAHEVRIEDGNRDADRASREKVQLMEFTRDILMHPGVEPQVAADEAKRLSGELGIKPKDGGDAS